MIKLDEQTKNKLNQESKNLLRNSKFYDPSFYKRFNPKVRNLNLSDDELLDYYIKHNHDELVPPSRFFDIKWYIAHNKDVKNIDIDPLIHFLKIGQKEGRLYRPTQLNFDMVNVDNKRKVQKQYMKIFHSELFDIDYYLNNNDDFDLKGLDPIIHYITIGANLGYNPSSEFNTNEYIENTSLNKVLVNPLYHYLKYGKDISETKMKETLIDESHGIMDIRPLPAGTVDDILDHLENKISIIIPIYNAYDETRQCICSVLLNTHLNYELVLINDNSTDERIKPLLDQLSDLENVKVIHNTENKGFVANVNLGIKQSKNNDVVLLNSDTIVTPRWLTRMVIAAYHNPTVATVTPLSNNSDISVEKLGISNDQLVLNKNAYQLSKLNYDSYHIAPTGSGFCLYIKKGALNKLGLFDPIFKQGYGEETDFTSRARKAGWKNIRSFDTFIYHQRYASFSKESTDKLKEENKKINMKRHPEVFDLWDKFVNDKKTKDAIKQANNIYAYDNGEKILYITQKDTNGKLKITPQFYEIAKEYDTHILSIDDDTIELYLYDGIFNFIKIYENTINEHSNQLIKQMYFRLLSMLRYDLLYISDKLYNESIEYMKDDLIKTTQLLEIPIIHEQQNNTLKQIDEKLNPIKALESIANDIRRKNNTTIYYKVELDDNTQNIDIPDEICETYDYVCFTNNPNLNSDFWDIRLLDSGDVKTYKQTQKLPQKYIQNYSYQIHDKNLTDHILKTESQLDTPEISQKTVNTILEKLDEPTVILLMADNEIENIKTCIKSIVENTNIPYELIIIDDNITNKDVTTLIDEYTSKYDNITRVINTKKQGFTKNVNKIIKTLENDLVILDSSTILTPMWLSKLKMTAYMDDKIATVTPVSNNAGIFSVPEIYQENTIDDNLTINDMACIVEKCNYTQINTPVLNRFCIFIKKDAINSIGMFDVKFNNSYSEVDYGIRIINQGLINVIDPTVYIYNNLKHTEDVEDEYMDKIYLNSKYPDHKEQLCEFIEDKTYFVLRKTLDNILKSSNTKDSSYENILCIVDDIESLNDKIQNKISNYNIYVLNTTNTTLYKAYTNTEDNKIDYELIKQLNNDNLSICFNILKQLHIKQVYLKNSENSLADEILNIAQTMGIKTKQ